MRSAAILVLLVLLSVPTALHAEVPQHFTLNMQVFEADDPFGFSYQGPVKVELFDDPEDGIALWSEVHQKVAVDFGFLSVPLGTVNTVTPLPAVLLLNASTPLFVQVTLGETGEKLAQRIELTSVPFALTCSRADDANTLEGKGALAFSLAGHQHTTADIADWPTEFPIAAHLHPWAEVTDKPGWLADGTVTWNEVGDKPVEFPPQAHQHAWNDLVDVLAVLEDGTVSWAEVLDKPAEFPPAAHDHDGQYLLLAGKSADAEMLDGLDSSEFAPASDTYGKAQVDEAIATAVAVAVGPLQTALEEQMAMLWCVENCGQDKFLDCKKRECNGLSQTCTESGAAEDGTPCKGGGWGRCLAGECLDPVVCGQIICPLLPGYTIMCNLVNARCEYANQDSSGWKKWDVWLWVPPGTFEMGSQGEGGPGDEKPLHTVTISNGYFIGKYEVLVAQYEACMAVNPEKCTAPDTTDNPVTQGTNTSGNGKSEHPQNGLTWQQAGNFCAWAAPGGRLPSEAEWEYAATGPVHTVYPWGNSPTPTCSNNTAVFNEAGGPQGYGCGQGGTWKAGSKTGGASWSGALDMSGNLWEWCGDWYHPSYSGAPSDGSAWVIPKGTDRVIRGGSYYHLVVELRSAERSNAIPGHRSAFLGARCVRPLP